MKDPTYWKKHYVIETDANEIERNIKLTIFVSRGKKFKLIYFEKSKRAPSILISPGEAGHSYVFAELGYLMHLKGYNVFIMPKHGSAATVSELVQRHKDAIDHISYNFNKRIGVFAEGFGGYAVFYLALNHGPMKSTVYQNAPAILTEKKFQDAWMKGKGTAKKRKRVLPLVKLLLKVFPNMKLPVRFYLDFKEMVDTKKENRNIEALLVEKYLKDSDFDRWKSLSAVMSLVLTPPPKPLEDLKIPTMLLVPKRGFTTPLYFRDLYNRLPKIKKKFLEVDGSVFWMVSHPQDATNIICKWFDETL